MRLEDIVDYYKLKKICENPYEILRFRKIKDENKQLAVKFRDGYKIFIQGGTDQYHTFHRVYLRDEYRIVVEYHVADEHSQEPNIQSLKKHLTNKGYRVETVPNKRKDNLGLFFCQKN